MSLKLKTEQRGECVQRNVRRRGVIADLGDREPQGREAVFDDCRGHFLTVGCGRVKFINFCVHLYIEAILGFGMFLAPCRSYVKLKEKLILNGMV